MKKVLILAYDFPPYVSVGGMRPYNWYRYLKEFDVEPIVITRQWSNTNGNHLDYISEGESEETIVEETEFGTIIRTPYYPNFANRIMLKYGNTKYKFLRKLISAYYEFAQYLFPIGPKIELYKAASAYLKKNKVDAILATGDPFVLFSYASKLSSEFNTPWIADYRDCWVQDNSRSNLRFTKAWYALFEKRYHRNSHTIVTVSPFIQKQIEQNIKGKNFNIILNGYNPNVMKNIDKIKQASDVLTISFAGTIYQWHPFESFLEVCNDFVKNGNNIRLNFFGVNNTESISNLISNKFNNIIDKVNIYPKTENEKLVSLLAESNAFILFNDYSILGTKIFTYLGIRRKILLCYSKDKNSNELKEKYYSLKEFDSESKELQSELITKTKSGIIVENPDHLLNILQMLNTEFKATGEISCNSIGIENYSRKIQVEILAKLINSIK